MNWTGWHFGRSFGGAGHLEESCPCPKADCGLVVYGQWSLNCLQHPPERAKTIRSSHAPEDCPCYSPITTTAAPNAPENAGISHAYSVLAVELTRREAARVHGMAGWPSTRPGWNRVFAPTRLAVKQRARNTRIHLHFDTLDWSQ